MNATNKWAYTIVLDTYIARLDENGDGDKLTSRGWEPLQGADFQDVQRNSLGVPNEAAARVWAGKNGFKWGGN